MGADAAMPAGLARAAVTAACALVAAAVWQHHATQSAHELAARIEASRPVAALVLADVSEARRGAAAYAVAATPWWVDHGSFCPVDAPGPLWVSHGSAAHRVEPASAPNVAV